MTLMQFCSWVHAAPAVIESFDSPAAAIADLVAKPRVIAFGEFHEIKGAAKATSALAHFRDELLASLVGSSSDLIVETWITTGNCGAAEEKAVAQIEETTKRPETTESEIVTLIKKAKGAGLQPHILSMDCHEYEKLTGGDGGDVDYVKLLQVVTDQLRKKIVARLAATKKAVLVYGGAMHNDVFPRRELARFSFAKDLDKRTKKKYLEVDLYVPEYVAADKDLTAEEWYPRYLAARAAGKTMRVKRSASSYILLFPPTNP